MALRLSRQLALGLWLWMVLSWVGTCSFPWDNPFNNERYLWVAASKTWVKLPPLSEAELVKRWVKKLVADSKGLKAPQSR